MTNSRDTRHQAIADTELDAEEVERRREIVARRREVALGELSRLEASGVRGRGGFSEDEPEDVLPHLLQRRAEKPGGNHETDDPKED